MAKNVLKKLLISVLAGLFISCTIPPTYKRTKIAETLKKVCKQEFNLDIDVHVWDTGNTVWVYAPVKLIDKEGKLNYDEKNKRWDDDLLKNMGKISMAINKVLLSIDEPPLFYCLVTSSTETFGLDWYTLVFLNDERTYTMQAYGAGHRISTQMMNKRVVSFNFRDPNALNDKEGRHIHKYDISMEEFIALLLQQKLTESFLSLEVKDNFFIRDLKVNLSGDDLEIVLDIMIKKYRQGLPIPMEEAEKIIKELYSIYKDFTSIRKVVINDTFNNKIRVIEFPISKKIKPISNYESVTKGLTLNQLYQVNFYLLLAEDNYQKNDFKQAEKFYRKIIEILPAYAHALNPIGFFLDKEKKSKEALEIFEKVLKNNLDDITALDGAARALVVLGRYEESLKYLEKLILLAPEYTDLYYTIGLTYGETGDYAKALKYLEKSLESYSLKEEVYRALAGIHHASGKSILALSNYRRALEIKPEYFEIHIDIANLHISENDLPKAVKAYEEALKINPDSYLVYYALGEIYFVAKEYSKAIFYCKKAIKINPKLADAYVIVGVSNNKLNPQYADTEYLEKALKLDPRNIAGQFFLGDAYLLQRKFQVAIKHFKEMIDDNPYYADAYVGLGRAYFYTDDIVSARINFNKAKQLYKKQNNLKASQEIDQYLNMIK